MSTSGSDHYETMTRDLAVLLRLLGVCARCDRSTAVIWDPFVCSGHSQTVIQRDLGFDVVDVGEHLQAGNDFFERPTPPHNATHVVSNPPFSRKQQVLGRLFEWRLPFALILPSSVVQRDYFLSLCQANDHRWRMRIVLPNKTLVFLRNGRRQHLPPFKLMYLLAWPMDNDDDQRQRCAHVTLAESRFRPSNVTIDLIDYEKLLLQI